MLRDEPEAARLPHSKLAPDVFLLRSREAVTVQCQYTIQRNPKEGLKVVSQEMLDRLPVLRFIFRHRLGGITDATNVGDGQVSVVTPISLDHTDLLGDTVYDIALEKAGIIKPGGFLVSSEQEADAAQVLLEKAREVGAEYRFEGVEFGVERRDIAVGGQSEFGAACGAEE